MTPYRVILVVDRAFALKVRELPEGVPAWVVDTPANHPAIVALRQMRSGTNHLTGLTAFRDVPKLSPSDLAASVIEEIETHHGIHSHEPPFSRLTVIGAFASPALTASLEEIGFQFVSANGAQLEFSKKAAPDAPATTPAPRSST